MRIMVYPSFCIRKENASMQLTKKLLRQIIDSNFKVWLLAGHAKEFETWQMSTRAVRDILWAESYFFGLRWDCQKQSVRFKGVGKNDNLAFTFKFCEFVD